MGSPQTASMALVNRDKPTPLGSNAEVELRTTRYGDNINQPLNGGHFGVADEGSYFAFTNPTPGTGIAANANGPAAVSETAGYLFVVRNNDGIGGKRITMDFLKLIAVTQAWTSATKMDYFWKLGPNANHYTSGGSAITPVNTNGDAGASSVAQIYFGALLTVADSAARLVDRGTMRGVIPVLLDTWIFKFGGVEAATPTSLGGTVPLVIPIPVPPVVIPPNWHLSLQTWGASGAATPQYEFAGGYWER